MHVSFNPMICRLNTNYIFYTDLPLWIIFFCSKIQFSYKFWFNFSIPKSPWLQKTWIYSKIFGFDIMSYLGWVRKPWPARDVNVMLYMPTKLPILQIRIQWTSTYVMGKCFWEIDINIKITHIVINIANK